MKQKIKREFVSTVTSMLMNSGIISAHEAQDNSSDLRFSRLTGDGSSREFFRISLRDKILCLAVAPGGDGEKKRAEARSARLIGCHLHRCGVPVPVQYGYHEEHGIILFEDLGDTKLHDIVQRLQGSSQVLDVEMIRPWYRQVLENLVVMQVKAVVAFDPGWCWDGERYDFKVMLEKESGYFLRSFWQDLLNSPVVNGIEEEFVELARICEQAPPLYFLHRDFQSRNIMIKDDRVRFIDFQGGRLGPLQYDLASLLIDPYIRLPQDFQEELFDYYLNCIVTEAEVDVKQIQSLYDYLAVQRNLQIIGAFSFLSLKRHKRFFRQFIGPALVTLNDRLSRARFDNFPILRKTAASSLNMLQNI